MKSFRKFVADFFTSKTLALTLAENQRLKEANFALEDENDKLRAELRGAVNTLLGQAGVAPLPPAEEVKTPPQPRMRRLTWQQRQRLYAIATVPQEKEQEDAAPVSRRT